MRLCVIEVLNKPRVKSLLGLYIVVVFLPSCSSIHMNVGTGLIDPAFGLTAVKDQTRQLSSMYTTAQVEGRLDTEHFVITLSGGPAWTAPLDGKSNMIGAEVTNRIQWKAAKHFQPYFLHAHGIHAHDTEWEGSDVGYEFSTRAALGVAVPIDDRVTLMIDYGYTHFSNGMSIWSDEMRKWAGLSKASENYGFESGMLSFGISIKL